jgi:serine protease Do
VAPTQLKEFKVYLPGDATSFSAQYLGQDALTGWHFVRVEEKLRAQLVPVTTFAAPGAPPVPVLAEEVWGLGLRNKDEDFAPYILKSHVALVQSLPQRTAIAQQEVAGPGMPVFNLAGQFLGLAATSFGQTFLQFSRMDRGGSPVMLINVEESSAFQLAEEVLPYLGRVPKNIYGRPLAWLGAYGFEPMDREVAAFLKLESQSGAVVSEVLEGSPAEKAGMQPRDIVLAIDGKALPRFKPDRVVVAHVEREVERRAPGDTLTLTVLRGSERVELKATLGDEPKLMREAERKYFEKLGFTAREFVYGDAIARRVKMSERTGVVAEFAKANSPAALAGLRTEDWIREIDGVEVKTFAAAVEKLAAIESNALRNEFVLLVSRGGDTAVLRVKLK